jgi:hypothetical protein
MFLSVKLKRKSSCNSLVNFLYSLEGFSLENNETAFFSLFLLWLYNAHFYIVERKKTNQRRKRKKSQEINDWCENKIQGNFIFLGFFSFYIVNDVNINLYINFQRLLKSPQIYLTSMEKREQRF